MLGNSRQRTWLVRMDSAQAAACLGWRLPICGLVLIALGCGGGDHGGASQDGDGSTPAAQNADNGQSPSSPGGGQGSSAQQASSNPSTAQDAFEPLELLTKLAIDFVGINALTFAPDGQTFVTGGDTPRIWQLGMDEPRHEFEGLYPLTGLVVEADALAISSDGSTLAIGGGDGILHLFDLATREPRQRIEAHEEGILSIAFSEDGTRIATSGYDGTAKLWNGETGDLLKVFEVEEDRGVKVDLTADGKTLVSAGEDALVWSAEGDAQVGDLNLGGERVVRVMAVAFSPDGRQIATAEANADFENGALLWATDTRRLTNTLKHEFGVQALAYSPDGEFLATADMEAKARIWRIADGQVVQTIENDEWNSVDIVAWTPDGKVLALVAEGTIHFWGREGAIAIDSAAPSKSDETAATTLEAEDAVILEPEVAPNESAASAIFPDAPFEIATPATVESMTQKIDLVNLPRIEGGDYQTTEATELSGLAPLPLPEAREFYRKLLLDAGWKELEQTLPQVDSDESWLREYEKDGFFLRVFFNALATSTEDQQSMLELLHTGNVDTRKLPMPLDANKSYETPVMTSYSTAADADAFIDACRNRFESLGWTFQGVEENFFGRKLTFVQNAVRLQVDVRKSAAGTDVMYDVFALKE